MSYKSMILALAALTLVPVTAQAAVPKLKIRTASAIGEERKAPATVRTRGFSGHAGLELRGASSRAFPKQSYALETRTRKGRNRDVALLGLPRENDWILEPAYADPSLSRNVVAYATARRLGRWAPRTRYVELTLNRRYRGVYVLTERPKLDGARVNVETKGVEGGYLLELTDRGLGHFRGPVSALPYEFKDPDRGDLEDGQRRYITGFVGDAERALQAGAWRDHVDEATAVDHLLLQELFKNRDAFVRSTFLVKGSDTKLQFGPLWDMDRSMGDPHTGDHAAPHGFVSPGRPWVGGLLGDAAFRERVAARWRELRAQGLLENLLNDLAAAERSLGSVAAERNAKRWPGMQRDGHTAAVAAVGSWLQARVAWLDENMDRLGA